MSGRRGQVHQNGHFLALVRPTEMNGVYSVPAAGF